MTNVNDLQSKRKHQGEDLNEQKTSIVRCHEIVSCTTSLAHINDRIIAVSFIHTLISSFLNAGALYK